MRIKILAHQKGEIHHFFKPKFAAFYHWKMPHIWTLFRPAAPSAPKRGENILKGTRGPDTPPVSPSAWPAQPAGLTPRRRASPPPQRHPAPCLAADRGALTARRPWAAACPCRLRRLRVPSNAKNEDRTLGVPTPFLSARLWRIISRDIYIYKVGWVAYRTILLHRGPCCHAPRQGQGHARRDASPCISPLEE